MTIAAVATVPIFIRPLGLSGERVAYRAARACFYVCFCGRYWG